MSKVQPNAFKISTIQFKKFSFEQTGKLGRDKKELSIKQSIGAIAKKQVEERKKIEYIIQVEVNIDVMRSRNKVFNVNSSIIGAIEVEIGFDEIYLNNMVAIIYSYLRPIVAQMTVMAKLPPLDLPPANFENFKVEIIKEKAEKR